MCVSLDGEELEVLFQFQVVEKLNFILADHKWWLSHFVFKPGRVMLDWHSVQRRRENLIGGVGV